MQARQRKPRFRLYVDEVGHSGLEHIDEASRFLSLTGVVFELAHVNANFAQRLERMKAVFFPSHCVDDPVILHRKEIINKKGPFWPLRDKEIEARFNDELLGLLSDAKYTAITVNIDKVEHVARYKSWKEDPYHYCLQVMLERYVYFLGINNACGDVLAESRGGKEDVRLKEAFRKLYDFGTNYTKAEGFQSALTSSEIKIKLKSNNIPGLQIADLLAHPGFAFSQCSRNKQAMPENFGKKIASILYERKFLRGPGGKLFGWGIKWLP